jgi:hypothetical protein
VFDVGVSVDSQRPTAAIISKTVKRLRATGENAIYLADERELPLQAELTFSLRAESPPLFTREDKLEVATNDGTSSVVLSVGAGGVMLQSAKVAVATLDPEKAFGASAFGPLRLRRIIGGVAGGWQSLVTLVRLPSLSGVDCPAEPGAACSLVGGNLFLLDSVSRDAKFTQPTPIPDGFTDPTLLIPHPTDGQLYIKLRDDPSVVSIAVLTVRTRSSAHNAAASADSSQQPPKTAAPGSPSHEQP